MIKRNNNKLKNKKYITILTLLFNIYYLFRIIKLKLHLINLKKNQNYYVYFVEESLVQKKII